MEEQMDYRILGPLEVRDGSRLLGLGGDKQRALLAILLLRRNEVVSADRLIDDLWGESPPARAVRTLQVYVSRLRKALDANGAVPTTALGDPSLGSDGGVLITRGHGYLLRVAAGALDLDRFGELVERGRHALASGEPERAATVLQEALGLWRGPPLADFAYEQFAQAPIAQLEELQLAAVEERVEADLALGRERELVGELRELVERYPLRERLRGQLMLALYRCGRQAEALQAFQEFRHGLSGELGLEPSEALQLLERSILARDVSLAGGLTRGGPAGVCPFKGLAFFDRADAEYFFGRERLVSDLLARLVESTLVGILGPSGIGKSSLLRAGLLPALSAGALPGSASWRQLLLRPGEHPCAEIERALDGERLARVLGWLSPGERIVVAVDQLEELFTVCRLAEERAAFLEQLVAAARDGDRRALVAVSLRADFYGRLAAYPAFAELLSGSHVLVGPMDDDELARAIEQPAALAGLEVERTLVDALVAHVAGEPGGLPLLSTTLLELWRTRDGRALRFDSYRTSGGVRAAVARLAEAAYTRLDEGEQRIARSVMLRLAGGEDGTLVGRRLPLAELKRLAGAERVVATLTDARLLTVTDGEVELSHEALLREWPRYRTWLEEDRAGRRLFTHLTSSAREWDSRGRDPGELYRGARLAGALEWAAEHNDQLSLPERRFLDASRRHAARNTRRRYAVLFGVGLLLLAAAVAGAIAVVQKRHATAEARVALARQLGAEAVSEPRLDLAMLLAREAVNLDRSPQTEATLLATLQRSPAVIATLAQPVNASPEQLAVSPDGQTLAVGSLLLGSLRLYDLRTHAAGPAVADFGGDQPPVYSSDGSLLVYPAFSGGTGAWVLVARDAHTLALRATLEFERSHSDAVPSSVLVAPDGRTVYCVYSTPTASGRGAAYLGRWSLPSGRRLSGARVGYGLSPASGLVDADGRLTIVWAGSATTFDTQSLRRVGTSPIPRTATPWSTAISPDGRTVVIGSKTGRVSFIDLSSGAARTGPGGHSAPISNVVYSPGGHTVTTTGNDGKVIVWDPETASPLEVLNGPVAQPGGVALSADGRTLYTYSLDGLVLAWDLVGDRSFGLRFRLGPRLRCCGPVSPPAPPLAVSPDGSRFAVQLSASTVGLFSTSTLQRQASFTVGPRSAVITSLAWSPTGPALAVGGYSGLLQLWNLARAPRLTRTFVGLQALSKTLPEAIQSVAFSPDGSLLAASDETETTQQPGLPPGIRQADLAIWRASTGRLITERVGLGPSFPGSSDVIAFARDGKLLAVSQSGQPGATTQVLDPPTLQTKRTLPPLGDNAVSLAFAPDGKLATGTSGGTVQLWNPTSGEQTARALLAALTPITSIAFDATGRQFATTSAQHGEVKLWFTSTLEQDGATLATERGATSTVAFEPLGGNLLVVDDHGNAFTWPTSPATWEKRACAVAGRNLTREEWSTYLPGRPYTSVCP
jgi:DNA-binding SARP family transcriptional activator/WD40 repeat protein